MFSVRISHLLFSILLGVCFIGGCHHDDDAEFFAGEEPLLKEETLFETTLTITGQGDHSAPSLEVGEPIVFTLAVRNITDQEISTYYSGGHFVIYAFDAGTDRLIWDSQVQWSMHITVKKKPVFK